MNEQQIRKLAEQAGYDMDMQQHQKFAELIVRECQTVVEWAISVDSTIDRVPVLIREHFGVEE